MKNINRLQLEDDVGGGDNRITDTTTGNDHCVVWIDGATEANAMDLCTCTAMRKMEDLIRTVGGGNSGNIRLAVTVARRTRSIGTLDVAFAVALAVLVLLATVVPVVVSTRIAPAVASPSATFTVPTLAALVSSHWSTDAMQSPLFKGLDIVVGIDPWREGAVEVVHFARGLLCKEAKVVIYIIHLGQRR